MSELEQLFTCNEIVDYKKMSEHLYQKFQEITEKYNNLEILKYLPLVKENKELKEQLQQSEEVIEETIEFIINHSRKEPPYYEFIEFYSKANLSELLDILNKYKKEESE